jgi:hypothetical protein
MNEERGETRKERGVSFFSFSTVEKRGRGERCAVLSWDGRGDVVETVGRERETGSHHPLYNTRRDGSHMRTCKNNSFR